MKVGVLDAALRPEAEVERRRNGREELGAREGKASLEFGQISLAHFVHLLRVVLLFQHRVKRLVNALWVQNQTDGQQGVHLVSLLVDLVVLVSLSLQRTTLVNNFFTITGQKISPNIEFVH